MAIKVNNLYVDEAYSPIVVKALWANQVLIPGITYTDKYYERAGKIYIHKEIKGVVNPGAPGRDFSSQNAEDGLVEILVNQNFSRDKKIYGVQLAQVQYDVVASQVDLVGREIGAGRQKTGLAFLANEASVYASNEKLTGTNVKKHLVAIRKKIVDAGGSFDYIIASTSAYAAILEDKANFVPEMNDEQLRNGIVGRYLGANVLEANALQGNVKPYGWETTYDLSKIDLIAGSADAFSVVDQLDLLRVRDSENFNGVRVQGEANCGFKVLSPEAIVVKLNDGTVNTNENTFYVEAETGTTTKTVLVELLNGKFADTLAHTDFTVIGSSTSAVALSEDKTVATLTLADANTDIVITAIATTKIVGYDVDINNVSGLPLVVKTAA